MTPTRTALVTGANRGIGLGIAGALAARGDIRVLAGARDPAQAEQAASEIGGGAVGVQLDLADPVAAAERAAAIEAKHGPVEILVNNAAILTEGSALEIGSEELTESLTVNAVSPFALIRVLGPGMRERGWGRIVNVSSGLGTFADGLVGPAAYSISKATLNAVTVSTARALGPAVKVNAACPGWVKTGMGGAGADRSVEEGADTPVWLATLDDDGPTGGIFRDRQAIKW